MLEKVMSILLILLFPISQVKAKEVQNLEVKNMTFFYETSDGGFRLECEYSKNEALFGDFQVVCGKGSPTVKNFLVHLLLRSHLEKNKKIKKIEILYTLHDINQTKTQFSSISQLLEFQIESQFQKFSMGLGLENDAAQLNISGEVLIQ